MEDGSVQQLFYKRLAAKAFPNHDIVVTSDLTTAADILTDDNKNVVATIIDNGFPLRQGGARKGKSRSPEIDSAEKEKLDKEGGAGTMLIRFIRTGKSGALADSTLEELGSDLNVLGDPSTRYKNIPIVWNSALPEAGKIAAVKAAADGKEIEPQKPEFSDKTLKVTPGKVLVIDEHTAATDKTSASAMMDYLKDQLAHQMSVQRREGGHVASL